MFLSNGNKKFRHYTFASTLAWNIIKSFMPSYSYSLNIFLNFLFHLKVGLLGMGRSLQRDLDRIAETADTSTPEGLGYVLTGKTSEISIVILFLLPLPPFSLVIVKCSNYWNRSYLHSLCYVGFCDRSFYSESTQVKHSKWVKNCWLICSTDACCLIYE